MQTRPDLVKLGVLKKQADKQIMGFPDSTICLLGIFAVGWCPAVHGFQLKEFSYEITYYDSIEKFAAEWMYVHQGQCNLTNDQVLFYESLADDYDLELLLKSNEKTKKITLKELDETEIEQKSNLLKNDESADSSEPKLEKMGYKRLKSLMNRRRKRFTKWRPPPRGEFPPIPEFEDYTKHEGIPVPPPWTGDEDTNKKINTPENINYVVINPDYKLKPIGTEERQKRHASPSKRLKGFFISPFLGISDDIGRFLRTRREFSSYSTEERTRFLAAWDTLASREMVGGLTVVSLMAKWHQFTCSPTAYDSFTWHSDFLYK